MDNFDWDRIRAVSEWTQARKDVKRLEEEARKKRQKVKDLERNHPFLGNLKGLVSKKSRTKPVKKTPPPEPSKKDKAEPQASGSGAKKRKLVEALPKEKGKEGPFKNTAWLGGSGGVSLEVHQLGAPRRTKVLSPPPLAVENASLRAQLEKVTMELALDRSRRELSLDQSIEGEAEGSIIEQ